MIKLPSPAGSKRRRSSVCRITLGSVDNEEHHYVPAPPPHAPVTSSCRITAKYRAMDHHRYVYPVPGPTSGSTSLVTEAEFHCRITAKYRAMAGHSYVYPVLFPSPEPPADLAPADPSDPELGQLLIPPEVDALVPGGVTDILRRGNDLFVESGSGQVFPAAIRQISIKKSARRSKTMPIILDHSILEVKPPTTMPKVKCFADLRKQEPIRLENAQPLDTAGNQTEIKCQTLVNDFEVVRAAAEKRDCITAPRCEFAELHMGGVCAVHATDMDVLDLSVTDRLQSCWTPALLRSSFRKLCICSEMNGIS